MNRLRSPALLVLLTACSDSKDGSELPDQADKWVDSVKLQDDSKARYVEKSGMVSSRVKPLTGLQSVSIGDEIEGVKIGAIRCSFFPKDQSYGGELFMWRGRYGCMAGRNKDEIENAVQSDGNKLYDYVHVSPVSLQ
ncbi:hypothetical protein GR223_23480 [Rhizobium leguminosarum]|uniref:hypothetical protein n=1 Tax=Rhizobium ruizarguesonis TaxID=2081791 RepID=UPI0013DF1922|nr:hypothetical protein [Rhizobium ruizarguesonis]NEJ88858.1 hypothetical protein [Rhizobium ruizarguesonis]